MSLIKTVSFKPLGDERGSLVALEAMSSISFDIKRVYYLFGTREGVVRGFHAHKALRQVAICVMGSCRFILDDGFKKQEIILNSATMGLLIDDMIWHEMHDFSPDCVLMVLANQYYDELDYIRNYDEFMEKAKK